MRKERKNRLRYLRHTGISQYEKFTGEEEVVKPGNRLFTIKKEGTFGQKRRKCAYVQENDKPGKIATARRDDASKSLNRQVSVTGLLLSHHISAGLWHDFRVAQAESQTSNFIDQTFGAKVRLLRSSNNNIC